MTNSPFGGFSFDNSSNESEDAIFSPTPAEAPAPAPAPKQTKPAKPAKAAKPPREPKAPKVKKERTKKAPKLGSEVRRDRVSLQGRKFLALSVTFVVLVAVGVMSLLSSASQTAQNAWVLRASSQLNAGEVIAAADITISEITLGNEDKEAIGAIDRLDAEALASDLIGMTVVGTVFEGQQLRSGMFSEIELTIGRDMNPTQRLVSVSASVASSLAGIVEAGDIVDVIAVSSSGTAVLVADAAEVVAVAAPEAAFRSAQQMQAANGSLDASEILPSDPIPGVYTMLVSAEEAMPLAAADAAASLYLIGRSAGAETLSPVVDYLAYGCLQVTEGVIPSACERYLLDNMGFDGTVAG